MGSLSMTVACTGNHVDLTTESLTESDSIPAEAVHPNLFLNEREIQQIRARIQSGVEPLATQFEVLLTRAELPLDPIYSGREAQGLYNFLRPNSSKPVYNALAYSVTQDESYALRVKTDLLKLAATSLSQVENYLDFEDETNQRPIVNVALDLSIAFTDFAFAFDLIYYSANFSEDERLVVRAWFEKAYHLIKQGAQYWQENVNYCHHSSNHVTNHLTGLVSLAYVLDQPLLAESLLLGQEVPKNWLNLIEEVVYMKGDEILGCDRRDPGLTPERGEIVDRYRHYDQSTHKGYGYSLLTVVNLSLSAEAALHHGIDLFRYEASTGESLKLPAQYYSYYYGTFYEIGGDNQVQIQPSGYPGEENYTDEILRRDYNNLFELMSKRYNNDPQITRAFTKIENEPRERYNFQPGFFGKMFERGRLSWDFHIDADFEGWKIDETASVIDGSLKVISAAGQIMVKSPDLHLEASDYNKAILRLKLERTGAASDTVNAKISWQTSLGFGGQMNRSLKIIDNQYYDIEFDLGQLDLWRGEITSLKFQLEQVPGVGITIDYIRLED